MFEDLKKKTGYFQLKKRMKNLRRNRAFKNLETAKSIGVIYILNDEATWNAVLQIVSQLKQSGISVKSTGVFYGNQKPLYAVENLSMDICSENDMNWYKKPRSVRVNDFINTPFDLLINLSFHPDFPTCYIAGLSKALCKVGIAGLDPNIDQLYDIEITPAILPQNIQASYAEIQRCLAQLKMEN